MFKQIIIGTQFYLIFFCIRPIVYSRDIAPYFIYLFIYIYVAVNFWSQLIFFSN